MIYIKTNLEKIPEACEVCPYSKKYGAVGERFCKILEAYFTGNIEPPYKERPDDCPFCEMQESISAADCRNCVCKEVCMYKEDLEKCSKAISGLKIPTDDARYNTMSLNEKYFYSRPEAEIRHYAYIKKAEAIQSIKDLEHYGDTAARAIREAEAIIESLKEYQQTLYTRYQEIIGTNYKLVLFLERQVNLYNNSKRYVITIFKRFDGNNVKNEEIRRETFEGKERHKALKRFEELKKEYPNIITETDIEKKHWER